MITRHDIAPSLIQSRVLARVAHYNALRETWKADAATRLEAYHANPHKTRWTPVPSSAADIDREIDRRIQREHQHYAHARVLECSQTRDLPFFLAFGQTPDTAQSRSSWGFASREEAQAWFLNGGR